MGCYFLDFSNTHKLCGIKTWCAGSRTAEGRDRKSPGLIEQVNIEAGWFEKV